MLLLFDVLSGVRMDLTNIRRQIQIVYARVASRTVTASDGTSVMELAKKMVDLEKAGELKSDEDIKKSSKCHAMVGEILDFLDRERNRSTIKLEKLQLRFSGRPSDWPKFKALLLKTLSSCPWSVEEKHLLLENALPGYLKRYLPTSLTDESFDWVINHLSDKFGTMDMQISEWFRNLSNVKFSPFASVSEIALRLDRLIFQAKELGVSQDQLRLPFIEAMKSVISSHKRLETAILPVINKPPSEIIEILKQLADGELILGSRKQSSSINSFGWQRRDSFRRESACIFCNKDGHLSFKCNVGSAESRRNVAVNKRICFRCLKPGHVGVKCTSKIKCNKCNGSHSSALCLKKPTLHNMELDDEERSSSNQQQEAAIKMLNLN